MRQISQKVPQSTFHIQVLFSLKHPILKAFLVKNHPNHEKTLLAFKKKKKLSDYSECEDLAKCEK